MAILDMDKYARRLDKISLMPCRGSVVRVAGMSIESKGPPIGIGHLCEIHLSSGQRVLAEVVGFHNENRILIPLESINGISPNDLVTAVSTPQFIQLGDSLLGRVIDGLGRPIDGAGPIEGQSVCSLDRVPPPPLSRRKISEPLSFGIRVFDGVLTTGKGQRLGIFSGSGVGKSTLLGAIARSSDADVNVLALVGERGREVRHFIEECLGPAGLAKSVVAVATSDTSPVQRVKVAFTATTIAEYFREKGKNVLFMMDSLTRFAHAQCEIGLAAGEPPTTKGYCPSVFSLLPKLTERLGSDANGSITGIYTILVEGDDMNDPVADSVRSLLDGHVVLSRKLAEQGHYPAVDILQSVSRIMPDVVGREHLQAAQKLKAILATYYSAEDLINIGALAPGSNKRIDKAIALIEKAREFLQQPLSQRTPMPETVSKLLELTKAWDFSVAV